MMYCDCREKPLAVRELIHERDSTRDEHTAAARCHEDLLELAIEYVLDVDSEVDQLEKDMDYEIGQWAWDMKLYSWPGARPPRWD